MTFTKQKITRKKIVLGILLAILILIVGGALIWLNDVYPAGEAVDACIEESNDVSFTEIDEGLFIDGSGTESALIFYPGAKVEYTAYVPLMTQLAQNGIDVFLIRMPCNLAVLGKNKADAILSNYTYAHWYLGGHSLGGAMAADYVASCLKNGKTCPEGLILLAAYPTKSLADGDVRVLTIYGSEDGVINRKRLQDGKSLLPNSAQETVIEGGNHAQFGCYGVQKGDNAASITQEQQWQQASECILEWIGR